MWCTPMPGICAEFLDKPFTNPPSPELPSSHPVPSLQREDILACVQEYADVAVWRVTDDVNGNPIVTISPEDLGLV